MCKAKLAYHDRLCGVRVATVVARVSGGAACLALLSLILCSLSVRRDYVSNIDFMSDPRYEEKRKEDRAGCAASFANFSCAALREREPRLCEIFPEDYYYGRGDTPAYSEAYAVVTSGTCASHGHLSITEHSKCKDAAVSLAMCDVLIEERSLSYAAPGCVDSRHELIMNVYVGGTRRECDEYDKCICEKKRNSSSSNSSSSGGGSGGGSGTGGRRLLSGGFRLWYDRARNVLGLNRPRQLSEYDRGGQSYCKKDSDGGDASWKRQKYDRVGANFPGTCEDLWTSPQFLAEELCCNGDEPILYEYNDDFNVHNRDAVDGIFALVASVIILLGILPAFFGGCLYPKRTASAAVNASEGCQIWRCCLYTSVTLTTALSCMAGFGLWVVAVLVHSFQWDHPCSENYYYAKEGLYLWEYEEALNAKCKYNEACTALTKEVELPPDVTESQFGPSSENCHAYERHAGRVVSSLWILFVVLGCAMFVSVLNCISLCCSPHREAQVHQVQAVTGTVVMMTDMTGTVVPQPVQELRPLPNRVPSLGSSGEEGHAPNSLKG
eukprot:g4763.t1